MQVSESNKKEADKVLEIHYNTSDINIKQAIRHTIQDRQSVLEAFKKSDTHHWNNKLITEYFNQQIQSLTEQIEYLKSKL
jgi:hypothetical protein